MSYEFSGRTWPQLEEAIKKETTLLLPFGQTEQHGLHLQVGADTIIAERVAEAVAERVNPEVPVLVLPAVPYGFVPQAVKRWPGTFSVRWQVIVDYLADVCSSAIEMGFRKLVIVSTHGPHGDIGRLAAREVFDRTGVGIVFTQPQTMAADAFKEIRRSSMGGACHAGEYETSLLMHFGYPVDLSGTDDRDALKIGSEWVGGDAFGGSGKVSWSTWALQESETGAYGDPSVACVETGARCMDAIVEAYARFLKYFREHQPPVRDEITVSAD